MLSILIPTYNYNVYNLVLELHKQCMELGVIFEIIVIDDGSNSYILENQKINTLQYCSYETLKSNIGRSAIRNLLAQKGNYEWFIFLDADVFPKDKNFISTYIKSINKEEKIVNGGLLYPDKKPKKSQVFRWLYGKERESLPYKKRRNNPYLSFLTLNFLISKSIFEKVKFNETIPNLRHEDTLFSYNLMQKNIQIEHIDNPIYHYGIDDFEIAIKKEEESLVALNYLIENQLISTDYVRIYKLFSKIKKYNLIFAFHFFHIITRSFFIKNLASSNPSLFIFDLYRMGYLAKLETNKKRY